LRVISLRGKELVADKLWLLSKHIDEITLRNEVDENEFFNVYRNISILDSSLQIAVIYGATYLASNKERGDLSLEILKTAQIFYPDNFQFIFMELVFSIVYSEIKDVSHLKQVASKIEKIPNSEKYIGRIDVAKWVDDIIFYLLEKNRISEIKESDKIWLQNLKKD
jgi:hypothetical protein